MVGYGEALTEEQIWELVSYIQGGLKKGPASE
jgi:mono/diheme cytochrome c family protein